MAKAASYSTHTETQDSTGRYVVESFLSRLKSWTTLGTRLAVVYAVWILGAYALHGYTSVDGFAQLAAVAYWFGWFFASVTALFFVVMLLTGIFQDIRRPAR